MRWGVVNEDALLLQYDQKISPDVLNEVRADAALISQNLGRYITELVPSYASILVLADLRQISPSALGEQISALLESKPKLATPITPRAVEIPVYYSDEVAPDLARLAEFAQLEVDEVISLHTAPSYDAYALGFAPGFAYLGEVDPRLAMPRRANPRKSVAAGSVGIAGAQTAIYPLPSPGGWRIIGRTPMSMLDYNTPPYSRIQPGDMVRFNAIDRQQYLELGGVLE